MMLLHFSSAGKENCILSEGERTYYGFNVEVAVFSVTHEMLGNLYSDLKHTELFRIKAKKMRNLLVNSISSM